MPETLRPGGGHRDRSARGDHGQPDRRRRDQSRVSFDAESRAAVLDTIGTTTYRSPTGPAVGGSPTLARSWSDCGSDAVRVRADGGARSTASTGSGCGRSFHVDGGAWPQRAAGSPPDPHHDRAAAHRPGHGRRHADDGGDANADRHGPLRRRRDADGGARLGAPGRLDRRARTSIAGSSSCGRADDTASRSCSPSSRASRPARGGHSWLERRFLELCAGAGLPTPPHAAGPEPGARIALVARRLPVPGTPRRRRAPRVPLAPHDRTSWRETPSG